MRGRWVLGIVPVLSLAACSPIYTAEFSDIEVTRPDIAVPGAGSSGVTSVTFSFSIDSGNLGANANPSVQSQMASVKLTKLILAAKSGLSDLSFIRTLHALAYVPVDKTTLESSLQVEIADYERTSTATAVGATFSVPLPEPVDLLPLLDVTGQEPRRIYAVVNIGGTLPTANWTTDVTLALSVELRQ